MVITITKLAQIVKQQIRHPFVSLIHSHLHNFQELFEQASALSPLAERQEEGKKGDKIYHPQLSKNVLLYRKFDKYIPQPSFNM
jgi:hypothetical protein